MEKNNQVQIENAEVRHALLEILKSNVARISLKMLSDVINCFTCLKPSRWLLPRLVCVVR